MIVDRTIEYRCDSCGRHAVSHDLRSTAPVLWVSYQDVGAPVHFCPECWPKVRLRVRHD